MKLKFTLIALVAMLSGFAVNAANLQQADVLLPAGVSESSFGDNTVVDGTNYYATLQAAVEAVAGEENAVLYCKPGADVGSLQHAPVTSTLTVYGNGARVTGGSERDFDLGNTDPSGGKDITADMTLKVVSLNGCGAWGAKVTEHTVNLVFENCENMGKVFITGTTGTLNISLTDCTFEGVIKEAVYSNADGNITLNNVAFSNLNKAVNLNHKAAGTQTVTINGCSFTNCGADVAADQIPVRVLSSVAGGKTVLSVSNSTFSGTPEGGADILLDYGVGVTEATVKSTIANVLPENKDGNAEMVAVTKNEGYTNVESVVVAKIGETGYATFAEALTAAAAMTGDVTVEIYEKVTLAGPLAGSYSSIKFVGKAENAEIYLDIQGYSEAAGKKVVFEGLKLSKVAGGYIANAGFMNLAFGVYGATETTYTNCTFLNGAYASTGNVTFANCTFYRSHDRYGLWAYGNANITVDGCTFADIRGIKMYVESKDQQSAATLTVKNTDFTAVNDKPAIVLTYGKSVTLENNTYSSKGVFELDLDGKPNGVAVTSDVAPTCVNDNGACGVLVDGKIYTTVAQAAAVATSGSNVTLLHNSAETVEFPEGVILDKNGFEAAGVTVAQPVVVAKVGDVAYATLSEAFAAVTDDNQTVVICKDVTENLTGAYLRGNITTENGAKVTITLTNSGWLYCPYTFVLGENITLNVPALCYYAGGTQINGTLVVNAYYQLYAGTKLSINEPGSMTVKTEQFYLRYTDGDPNAGIYIKGDNNDETVGLNLSVAYFYQGTIYAKDANIVAGTYWQTNETDGQGSANLVLDNSTLTVTVYDHPAKATGNSTVTLTNGSILDAKNGGFTYGDNTAFSIDATSKIIGKNGELVTPPVAKIGDKKYKTFAEAYAAAQAGDTIVLLADVKLTGKMTISKAVSINGNGHSIVADETAVWYTVSGKLKNYKTHLLNINADGVVLKDIVLDCNNNAAGINVYCAQNVVFDNVSIINATKGNAALTVNGSTVIAKTAFTALGNAVAIDISNGSGVTSNLGFTVEEGTVFDLNNKTVKFATVAVTDMTNAVDAEGKAYFAAKDNAYYYTVAQMNSRTNAYNNGLTILADIELTRALNVKNTLELNGHSVITAIASTTLPEGYASLPNLDGKYVIGKKPTATVNNLGSITVAANDYKVYDGNGINNSGDQDMPLSFVMQFLADQSEEDMAASPFAKWYGDFVITFTGLENGSFTADGCYLAGHYGSFGWVKVPVDGMVIEEGVRYPVMLGVGMGIDYKYICSDVEDFKCALYLTPEILAANPNINVKLELGVVDSSKGLDEARDAIVENEKVYSVTSYKYTAEAFECPLSGEGTEASPFLIKNVNDLVLFRNSVNAPETKYNAEGVYVALGADIDLAGIDWSVNIGDDCNATFDGIFDGKGYKIKNLTATETAAKGDGYICTGLFGAIAGNAVVKNLTIENVTIDAPYAGNNIAAVVGFAYTAKGSIENVNVTGDININAPKATGVGAIVGYGYQSSLTIKDCEVIGNDGSEITAKAYAGGVIGYSTSKNINANTVENVTITATGSVGAVAGIMLAGGSADGNTIKNVSLSATGDLWANSAAVVAGTISGGSVTVANTSVENVTANGGAEATLVGGLLVEKPTEAIAKVEAKIGNKYYATLEEALKADGNEVELLVPITVAADETRVLDLNGKTVSHSMECTASYQMIYNKGNLTIKNGTLSFADTGAGDPSFGWGSYTVRNEGTLVVENATIEHLGQQSFATHMICAIFQYSGSTTINDATISTPNYRSVRLWKGDMTINGGTFDGQVWVQAVDNTADLTINGGTFEPNGGDASAVFVTNNTYDVEFAVTDGTFNGKIGCSDATKLAGCISGGRFNEAAKNGTNTALLATDWIFSETATDGYFTLVDDPTYISKLILVDGQFDAYDFATDMTVDTLTYKRTFSGLNWNAFYVPFEIEMSELIENYDIAYINDVNSYDNDNNGEIDEMKMEVIKITDENATLLANHPYLIRPKNEAAKAFSITLYDVTLFAAQEVTLDCTSMYTKFEVTGSYRRRGVEDLEGKLVLSGAGEWITMTVGTMNPCRLILTITSREGSPVKISPAAAKSICIVTRGEIDGTTGIEGVEYESTDAIYDLSGRRVNEITKAGVYVVNGKKVLVK